MNSARLSFIFRRVGSAIVDFSLEISGGLLGSYFGAMVAALVVAIRNENPSEMQTSMWSGFGFGFLFWCLAISFMNRVLIQGLTRATLGKKIFDLELVSLAAPLTWSVMTQRWAFSLLSAVMGGMGYGMMFFSKNEQTFHDWMTQTSVIQVKRRAYAHSLEEEDQEAKILPFVPKATTPEPSLMQQQINTKIFVLSNHQNERPMASLIQMPALDHLVEQSVSQETVKVLPFRKNEEKKAA